MQNPCQSLDDRARAARDHGAVRALTQEIIGRVLFAPLPTPLVERIIRAELTFKEGQSVAVTEGALAGAVNQLGRALGGALYTGTNALQIRLLRVAMFPDLPHLLNSPTPPPSTSLVGPDLSPAGATYLGFLLLRQKLTNPAWFGSPDEQNEAWVDHRARQTRVARSRQRFMRSSTSLGLRSEKKGELQHTDAADCSWRRFDAATPRKRFYDRSVSVVLPRRLGVGS